MNSTFTWQYDLSAKEWDKLIASNNGHPLQSASWGQARLISEGMIDHRWIAYKNADPVFMVRFEERSYAKYIKLAWVPRGPLILDLAVKSQALNDFLMQLKNKKFVLCVIFPWKSLNANFSAYLPQTIWVDLSVGKEIIWKKFDKRFRYAVRQAAKNGLNIEIYTKEEDIHYFFNLCKKLSKKKNFNLKMSTSLLKSLLNKIHTQFVESFLFIAKHNNHICGGAFIIKSGENIHYFFGTKDRNYNNKLSISESLQWAVIKWGIEKKCKLYDLEGIDIKNNASVYHFKKKLKGKVITFSGIEFFSLAYFMKPVSYFLNQLPSRLLYKLT